MKKVTVEACASSANLGSGFDVFAIALKEPVDRLTVSFRRGAVLRVDVGVPDGLGLPAEKRENVAWVVAHEACTEHGIRGDVEIKIEKKVPIGLGIGSSAASAAACAVAVNTLFDLGLGLEELLKLAGKGEGAVSGSVHYDNVSAAVCGGFVIVRAWPAPSVVRFEPPRWLRLCIATPDVKLPPRKTEYARSILPKEVKLSAMSKAIAMASTLVAGFATGDVEKIGEGMHDEVVEPVRSGLIPGYERVKKAAKRSGASGVCISGAGPSVLAVVDSSRADPNVVLSSMLDCFRSAGVGASGFVTAAGKGARVVETG